MNNPQGLHTCKDLGICQSHVAACRGNCRIDAIHAQLQAAHTTVDPWDQPTVLPSDLPQPTEPMGDLAALLHADTCMQRIAWGATSVIAGLAVGTLVLATLWAHDAPLRSTLHAAQAWLASAPAIAQTTTTGAP